MFSGIDLFSDTVTRPTEAMRQAIAGAQVGDEQMGEDPTTSRLEATLAEQLGFGQSLFFPTATMANEIALRLHTQPGDELIAAGNCHLFFAESGGPAIHAGLMARPIDTPTGIFGQNQLEQIYHHIDGPHFSRPTLISVENTTNNGGGRIWPKKSLDQVRTFAEAKGAKLHLDGARLFNAAVGQSVSPASLCDGFDTVTVCLSKGLGCPVGAVLAYRDPSMFAKLRRDKQLFGGALRQSGILAAAGLYALEHNVERLTDDHSNAQFFAGALHDQFPHLRVETPEPESNMVFFRWTHPQQKISDFHHHCQQLGLRFSQVAADRLRAVTHMDVGRSDLEKAVQIVREAYQS